MRVVSGTAKGRNLAAVPGDTTRPILDRVKTALFDTIRGEIQGAKVLDLFAGSGSVGIEALSQGAESCVFLDVAEKAVSTIKKNVATCGFETRSEVRSNDAFTYLRNTQKAFDLIYIAPPQYKGMWIDAMHFIAERPQLLTPEGMIIVQIDPKEYEALTLTALQEVDMRRYGNTQLVFYSHC